MDINVTVQFEAGQYSDAGLGAVMRAEGFVAGKIVAASYMDGYITFEIKCVDELEGLKTQALNLLVHGIVERECDLLAMITDMRESSGHR